MFLRAGKPAPTSLLNGVTTDTVTHAAVASSLLTPIWVTPTNMNATIVKDNFVPKSQLCSGKYASDCTAAGIS
jgi:D-xylose transport system substrate-binding protein